MSTPKVVLDPRHPFVQQPSIAMRRNANLRAPGGSGRERWPDIDSVYLHLQDARGMALPSIYAALRAVGDRTPHLETTVGGIGGCPYCGNGRATGMAATEDFVHMLDSMGIDTGIDVDAVIDVVDILERILGRSVPGHLAHAGPRPTPEKLYDENSPLVETHSEAGHFRDGPSVFENPHRPWREPIPARGQDRRDSAEATR